MSTRNIRQIQLVPGGHRVHSTAFRSTLLHSTPPYFTTHELAALLAGFLVELLVLLVLGPRQHPGNAKPDPDPDPDPDPIQPRQTDKSVSKYDSKQ